MSSSEVCEDPVASSQSKVLKALKSRYTCIHEPLPAVVNSARYLTSLRVYGNREVEEPQSPLSASVSIIDPQTVKEKVTSALKALSFREPRVLVQFWAPVAVRKRWLLTTLDQPFGLGVIDEELYLYRLESEQRMFVVAEEHREELGPPGRVYCQKLPEWNLDMHGLLTRQDWGSFHNIHGYINLPVFDPSNGRCVGVLELITSSKYVNYAFEVEQISRALKEENLKSPNVLEDTSFYARIGDEKRQLELNEIFWVVKMVCEIQNLPLAQTWGLCGYSSIVANSGNLERSCSSFSRNCIGKVCMSTTALPFYVRDLSMWEFRETCSARHLDKSQGVIGRSLSSRGSCFCGDVSKLSEDEYPLVPYARMHGITSCLAIYLKSIEVDGEYVIELFLPTHNENEAGLQSLVKTVKEQIKHVSRIQLGDISSTQVIGGIPLSLNLESPTLTEKAEVPLELPLELENLHPLVENEKNDCDVEQMEEGKPSDSVAEGTNQNVGVPYLDAGTKDADINASRRIEKDVDYSTKPVRKKMRTIRSIIVGKNKSPDSAAVGTNQNQHVAPYMDVRIEDVDINTEKRMEKYIDYSKKPVRKRKKTDRSISLEEISKHYGKPQEEAADSLGVSRSTLKRILRSHDIPRWPYTRTTNESDALMNPDQTDAAIHASDKALTTLVLGTPNAPNTTHDPAPLTEHIKHFSAAVLRPKEHKNLINGRAKPKKTDKDKHVENISENTFTIKVTYGMNTVKLLFKLSDGLENLEKLVASRFQLSHGSFRLKYEDEDGDMILIVCDNDLMASLIAFRQPDVQTVIRLLVWPVTDRNPDA